MSSLVDLITPSHWVKAVTVLDSGREVGLTCIGLTARVPRLFREAYVGQIVQRGICCAYLNNPKKQIGVMMTHLAEGESNTRRYRIGGQSPRRRVE